MRCPMCDAKVSRSDDFCPRCGADIPRKEKEEKPSAGYTNRCPECGAEWDTGDDFCPECGASAYGGRPEEDEY